jgi:hypothetical protein
MAFVIGKTITDLVQRGSITVWFSADAIDKWHATPQENEDIPPYIQTMLS